MEARRLSGDTVEGVQANSAAVGRSRAQRLLSTPEGKRVGSGRIRIVCVCVCVCLCGSMVASNID